MGTATRREVQGPALTPPPSLFWRQTSADTIHRNVMSGSSLANLHFTHRRSGWGISMKKTRNGGGKFSCSCCFKHFFRSVLNLFKNILCTHIAQAVFLNGKNRLPYSLFLSLPQPPSPLSTTVDFRFRKLPKVATLVTFEIDSLWGSTNSKWVCGQTASLFTVYLIY